MFCQNRLLRPTLADAGWHRVCLPASVPKILLVLAALMALPCQAAATAPIVVAGVPLEFGLFALTLLAVALFHHWTFYTALSGFALISLYKIAFSSLHGVSGFAGWLSLWSHEWVTLSNLFLLLTGFALLARHFEKSHLPLLLPKFLPDKQAGALALLVLVFIMSSFLDNIAAALIGGAMAHQLFQSRVHIGYLAAIVAASNAGGSGSVIGDTTTTMMWIQGISPLAVVDAYIAAVTAFACFAVLAARTQHRYSPMIKGSHATPSIDGGRITIVAMMLIFAVVVNVFVNRYHKNIASDFPFVGAAVWLAVLLSAPFRRHDWEILPEAAKGSVFLLALVGCAAMMPVENLPSPSWVSTLLLGFVSAVFDNIPLTALALRQGGYDWGFLAYAVGFGGSMLWFGSSAGVALSNLFPAAKSTGQWLRHGWPVILGYVVGYLVLLVTLGWHP